jgi:hypothetical protein
MPDHGRMLRSVIGNVEAIWLRSVSAERVRALAQRNAPVRKVFAMRRNI